MNRHFNLSLRLFFFKLMFFAFLPLVIEEVFQLSKFIKFVLKFSYYEITSFYFLVDFLVQSIFHTKYYPYPKLKQLIFSKKYFFAHYIIQLFTKGYFLFSTSTLITLYFLNLLNGIYLLSLFLILIINTSSAFTLKSGKNLKYLVNVILILTYIFLSTYVDSPIYCIIILTAYFIYQLLNIISTIRSIYYTDQSFGAGKNLLEKINIITKSPDFLLELRLMTRNKRPFGFTLFNGVLLSTAFFLMILESDSQEVLQHQILAFCSTGAYLFSSWQFLIAWDSSYFNLIATSNCKLFNWVQGKYSYLVFVMVSLFFLEVITILIIGKYYLIIHFIATFIFHIGITSFVFLLMSLFNIKPIDLGKSSLMNYQGSTIYQVITQLGILTIYSFMIYYLSMYLDKYYYVYLITTVISFILIFLRSRIFSFFIKKLISERKYRLIKSYGIN